jgi:hypothetical protein
MGRLLDIHDKPRKRFRRGRVASWLWYSDSLDDIRSVDFKPEGAVVIFFFRWHGASPFDTWRRIIVSLPKDMVISRAEEGFVESLGKPATTPAEIAFTASSVARVAYSAYRPEREDHPHNYYRGARITEDPRLLDTEGVKHFIDSWLWVRA